jgi:ABC-type multidrug transport system ATPase subunit
MQPTSGLDFSATLDVIRALKSLAGCGMNICCAVHQAVYCIYVLFDEVLLFGITGGVTAYLGPTEQMLAYFHRIGFEISLNDNPADFMLNVCSGSLARKGDPLFKPSDLNKLWTEEGIDFISSLQHEAVSFSHERSSMLNSVARTLPATLHYLDEALDDCGFILKEGETASDVKLDLKSMQNFLSHITADTMTEADAKQIMETIKPGNKGTISAEDIKTYVISNHENTPKQPYPTQDHEGVSVDMSGETPLEAGPARVKANNMIVFLALLRR